MKITSKPISIYQFTKSSYTIKRTSFHMLIEHIVRKTTHFTNFKHSQTHMNQSNDSLSDKNLTIFLLSILFTKRIMFLYGCICIIFPIYMYTKYDYRTCPKWKSRRFEDLGF